MYVEISESDLMRFPSTRKILESGDEYDIKIMFYALGMDMDLPIEVYQCNHRNLEGDVVFGNRYSGSERRDHFWMTSGYCSEENRRDVSTGNDLGFKMELNEMSRFPCFTQLFIDHLIAHCGEPEKEDFDESVEA